MPADHIAVIDLETPGLSPWSHNRVVEIAIVVISPDGTVHTEYETLVTQEAKGAGVVFGNDSRPLLCFPCRFRAILEMNHGDKNA